MDQLRLAHFQPRHQRILISFHNILDLDSFNYTGVYRKCIWHLSTYGYIFKHKLPPDQNWRSLVERRRNVFKSSCTQELNRKVSDKRDQIKHCEKPMLTLFNLTFISGNLVTILRKLNLMPRWHRLIIYYIIYIFFIISRCHQPYIYTYVV